MSSIDPRAEQSEEQQYRSMLKDSVRRMLADKWTADEEGGDLAGIWPVIVEQGLAALGSDPDVDDLPEILIVMRELGRAGCSAPLLAAVIANQAFGAVSPALTGARLAISFGAYDRDPLGGAATIENGCINATLRFVENMRIADTLMVIADGPAYCCIDVISENLEIQATSGLARPALSNVSFADIKANPLPTDKETVERLHAVARLCLAARALGAAEQGFALVLDYVKERFQFGQPIGQFQAIQHKLASCHILLEAASLQIEAAAEARAINPASWFLFAQSAIVFCAQNLRQVALETQHCFGAIGFAEEHAASQLFRRVHADITRMGGVMSARNDLAALIFDGEGDAFASADAGGADPAADIRAEVREWLQENWTTDHLAESRATPFRDRKWNLPFAKRLGDAGWTTLNWPKSANGQQRSPLEQLAFAQELLRAKAPDGPTIAGSRLLAPEIIAHGSQELREEILPALRAGTASVCLGYSEPQSGSDLASLKTKAEPAGDDYIINGQKIWTTDGDRATHMILAARTNADPDVKHGGISLFVLPMNTPGITVRPSMAMYGHNFCNIFFDDVRIPASMMLGPLNGGWRILANALASERVVMGAFASQVRDLLQRIVQDIKSRNMAQDAVIRSLIAGLAAEVEAARQLSLRSIRLSGGAYTPLVESAMAKVYASELSQRLTETAIDIFGTVATLEEDAPLVPADGLIDQLLRQSIMMVVGGGTNEIQRNVIAQRGLNLPVQR